MSVLHLVKRFFANTIDGCAEIFKHRFVDFEVVSRTPMCDIKAFGNEVMHLPVEIDKNEDVSVEKKGYEYDSDYEPENK